MCPPKVKTYGQKANWNSKNQDKILTKENGVVPSTDSKSQNHKKLLLDLLDHSRPCSFKYVYYFKFSTHWSSEILRNLIAPSTTRALL